MTVEKGLLRETKIVQKMIDALVETRVRSFLCFNCYGTHNAMPAVLLGRP